MNEIEQNQLWRSQYRQDRYMEKLSDNELIQRFRRVCGASVKVDDQRLDPKLVMINSLHEEGAHIMEEMELRGRPYPEMFKEKLNLGHLFAS